MGICAEVWGAMPQADNRAKQLLRRTWILQSSACPGSTACCLARARLARAGPCATAGPPAVHSASCDRRRHRRGRRFGLRLFLLFERHGGGNEGQQAILVHDARAFLICRLELRVACVLACPPSATLYKVLVVFGRQTLCCKMCVYVSALHTDDELMSEAKFRCIR